MHFDPVGSRFHAVAASIALVVSLASASGDGVTLAAPPVDGANAAYPGHKAPLASDPLIKLPIGCVKPRGWLEQQLRLMAGGMFGRLPEVSRWVRPKGSAWRDKDGLGENGWEELPYWLKGFTSLSHLMRDRQGAGLATTASQWIEAILASQREDGYFGPEANRKQPDLWPNMPILWAMRTHYEATGDPRLLAFLKKYFRYQLSLPREQLLPESWQKMRGGDNLDVVHWLYDTTGEAWLLELATVLHEQTADWTAGIASWHGVNFCQGFREPMQFFVQSKDAKHRDATLRNYAEMMDRFGQVPGGMFGADENCRPGFDDPRQGAEACSMVEFMLSFQMLAAISGETVWADRCEDVAFNSLPAAVDPEMKALHYLTPPNCVACDAKNHAPGIENDGCMLAFSADGRYRCCQHNVVQGWPYFTERCWMATRDGGLAALLWAPCEVQARVADDQTATVRVRTDYPLSETIEIEVETAEKARFPLYLRIPGWCSHAQVPGLGASPPPGSWVRIERAWKGKSSFTIALPAELRVRRFPKNHGAAAIDCGPLTYSLALIPKWSKLGEGEWAVSEVTTSDSWNVALALDAQRPESSVQLLRSPRDLKLVRDEVSSGERPTFEPKLLGIPIRHAFAVRTRRVTAWKLEHGLVGVLQDSPVRAAGPDEIRMLVPMGACYVRISAFPVLGEGEDAHDWSNPPVVTSASHEHDLLAALNDTLLPKDSSDRAVPRFTFWDHRGTVEWVQYDFSKPRRIGRCGVFWFDDTGDGRCRVPKSCRLLFLEPSSKDWREIPGANAIGVERDRLNEVRFTSVVAKSLRLEVTLQPNVSGGLFEWSVGDAGN